jgi:PAS domain S-box-containing protein
MKARLERLVPATERELHDAMERRERKQAVEALGVTQARLSNAMRIAHLGAWEYDVASDRFTFDDLFYSTLRTTAEREGGYAMSLARYIERFVYPDDRALVGPGIREAIETSNPRYTRRLEHRMKYADGEMGYVAVRFYIEKDKQGCTVKLYGVNQDITERITAFARIREQAEVINQAPVAVLITDRSNVVTYCNEGAVRLHGCKKEDLLGHTAESVFSPEAMKAYGHARSATWETGSWEGEVPILTRDGREIIAMYHMSVIRDEAGRPKARLTIATDITEKRRLEEESLRAQRLENLGMLAAGIAHDFNNALAPITMAGPLLRQQVRDPAGLRMLDIIEQCSGRGAALVRQMLSFARGTTGGKQLTQMKHVLREAVELSRSSFPKSIQIEAHLPNDLWPIIADPTQMHQVFLNLFVNARDAMPEGGIITVAAENRVLNDAEAAKIEGGRVGNFLAVDVRDTGTGISPEVLEKMWAPFFTTKGEGTGTGLGLSTVRAIVSHHEGFLAVHTSIQELHDHGTVFTIYLPAAEGESTNITAASDGPLPRGHGELILLVDDEATVVSIATKILTNIGGYRVITETNGADAITAFMRRIPDVRLLVTDLDMPIMGGLDLAGALREIKPALPIVIMTGLAPKLDEHIRTIPALFLAKPFEAQSLLKLVQRALAGTGSGSTFPPRT